MLRALLATAVLLTIVGGTAHADTLAIVDGTAHADTLATDSLFSDIAGDLICIATNVSSTSVREVVVTIISVPNGSIPPTTPPPPTSTTCAYLLPNSVCQTAIIITDFGGFCKITVKGANKQIRAALTTVDSSNKILALSQAR